jgi:putative endopeptidase
VDHRIRGICIAIGLCWGGIPSAAIPQQQFGAWGVDLSAMDTSIRPGDNFFQYANGGWNKRTSIPADRSEILQSPTPSKSVFL